MDEILDTLPCGVVSFSDDRAITFANRTFTNLLGYPDAEILGKRFESLLTVTGRSLARAHLFPVLASGTRVSELFLSFCTHERMEVFALVSAARQVRDGVPVNDCVVIQARDRRMHDEELMEAQRATDAMAAALASRTEELRRATLLADEANQARNRFLTTMSHELRTPLNAIGGHVQLIELGIHGPVTDAQRVALERINRSQRHLLRLINDILNTARVEAGHVEYLLEDVQVAGVVASVIPMMEPQMINAGLTLTSSVSLDVVARADRDKVQQVLINLLTNAIKFTQRGGRVNIGAGHDESGSRVRITVTDSGIGIPKKQVSGIFEPFVQVQVERSARREGTGLGLAISRDLARGMGGELSVESEVGVGSTFVLELPKG